MVALFCAGARREQDVGRLDVAMDEAPGVRGVEGVGDLPEDAGGRTRLEPSRLEARRQIRALDAGAWR